MENKVTSDKSGTAGNNNIHNNICLSLLNLLFIRFTLTNPHMLLTNYEVHQYTCHQVHPLSTDHTGFSLILHIP